MSEEMTQQQELESLLEQIKASFNPLDFLPPSQREIAMLSREELQAEYELVQAKQSTRSSVQRKMIVHLIENQKPEENESVN